MKKEQSLLNYDFIYLLAIFLILSLIFAKIIFLKEVFWGEDISFQNLPQRSFAAQELRKGNFPLWSPHIFAGYPIFAEGQSGILYPLNILFLFLPDYIAYHYLIILHFFLAGVFIYYLLRNWKISRFTCFLIALLTCFSFLSNFSLMNMFNTFIWLPLIILLFEKYSQNFNLAYLILASIITAQQFLTTHLQASFLVLFTVSLFAGYKIIEIWKKEKDKIKILRLGINLLSIIFIGILIASVQILPHYELIKLSPRAEGMSYEFIIQRSLPPARLFTGLLGFVPPHPPDLLTNALQGSHWYPYFLTLIFIILTFNLILNSRTIFLLSFTILCLILALGGYTPLYKILYYIPGFNMFRAPERFGEIVFLPLYALLGFSMDALMRVKGEEKRYLKDKLFYIIVGYLILSFISGYIYYFNQYKYLQLIKFLSFLTSGMRVAFILLSIFLILIYLFIQNKINQDIFSISLIILFLFLIILGIKTSPATFHPPDLIKLSELDAERWKENKNRVFKTHPSIYTHHPPFIKFLRNDPEIFRIIEWSEGPLRPNLNIYYQLSRMDGYGPLPLKHFVDLQQMQDDSLMKLYNIKYLLAPHQIKTTKYKLVYDKELKIYQSKEYFPRSYIVSSYKVMKKEEILAALGLGEFNLKDEVLLEEPPFRGEKHSPQLSVINNIPKIREYSSNKILIEVALKQSGFLVLSDTYYPGWKAKVDGKKSKIYRANYYFRALFLPAGKHQIEFYFFPSIFLTGLIISFGSLLIIGIYLLILTKRKKWHY